MNTSQLALARLKKKKVKHSNPLKISTRGKSIGIQHSTKTTQKPNTTSTNPEAHIHRQNRWEGGDKEGGIGSSPSASGSTFLVGNRPVKVCKKLALSVCEDMRLPQRSMAYGWDEWNGDSKISGGATKVWGHSSAREPLGLYAGSRIPHIYMHKTHFFCDCVAFQTWGHKTIKTQDGTTTPKCCATKQEEHWLECPTVEMQNGCIQVFKW